MSMISKRVSKHLIARQKRAARLKAFSEALDAGILECRSIGATEHCGAFWELTEGTAALLSGNFDQDRKLIRLLLEESSKSRKHGRTASLKRANRMRSTSMKKVAPVNLSICLTSPIDPLRGNLPRGPKLAV
jgi:hypothetical protein